MRLNITGKSSNVENKIIRDAAKFYLNEILRPTTFKKIEISIFLEENLYKNSGNFAEMFPTEIIIRPKEYEIILDSKLKKRNLLLCLAHEIIHIEQYVTDKMRLYSRTNDVLWKGKLYSENTNYWKSPWEIEAHKKELELYSQYIKSLTE